MTAVYAGIDLAADQARTALAVLREDEPGGRVVVASAVLGVSDDDLVAAVAEATKVGVDVPVGWPEPFVDFLRGHADGAVSAPESTGADWRRRMVMRRTDLLVRERFGLVPLSVAADRIAYPALRWAGIEARLRDLGVDTARDGSGRVAEVYPAAALRAWGLTHRGYKRAATEERERLIETLATRHSWLDWAGHREACIASDDVLDAVVAAMVAREVAQGRTVAPTERERPLALREGWIHVPHTPDRS